MANNVPSIDSVIRALGGEVVEWSPELWDTSNSGAEGQTYGADNKASATRVGNHVFIRGRLQVTSLGTLTGTDSARIGNLPFGGQGGEYFGIGVFFAAGLAIVAGQSVDGYVGGLQPRIYLRLWDSASGQSDMRVDEFSASGDIMFSGWYLTDD